MFKAGEVSMGFLRSLYFEQVKKSIADAYQEEARKKEEEQKAKKANNGRVVRPPLNLNNAKPTQQYKQDLQEALEELE